MSVRFRAFAAVSALCLVSTLVIAVSAHAASTQPVAFASTSAQSQLLAHYVVTPQARIAQSAQGGANANAVATQAEVDDSTADIPDAPAGLDISRSVSGESAGDSGNQDGLSEPAQDGNNLTTPPPSATFIGQQGSAKTCSYFAQGCNPPDMAIAASPSFVLQGVNTQYQVWDTSGNVQPGWPVRAQAFFGVPNVTNADGTPCDQSHGSQPFLSDPRALYDPSTGRFWAAILQVEGAIGIAQPPAKDACPLKSVYFIAVSQTSDPRGSWNVYEFEMTLGKQFLQLPVVADFTQIGLNDQAVYFSANMFTADGAHFAWAEIAEANKAQMQAGQASFTADAFFNLTATGPGAIYHAATVQPANNLDHSPRGVENFVDTFSGPDPVTGNRCGRTGKNDPCSGLAVWGLSNPTAHDTGGAAPTLTGAYVATSPYLINPSADQPTCNRCVAANDLRIPGTPTIHDGILYTAWGTAIQSVSKVVPGIQWAEVALSDGSAIDGYYTQTDTAVTYPILMPLPNGPVAMLFERMSHTILPETDYIVKEDEDSNFSGTGVVLKAGESSYRPTLCGVPAASGGIPVCRWGDYEAISFDGTGRVWLAGQYANLFGGVSNPPAFGRNWGTWIGAIG